MDNRKLSEEAGLDSDVYTWNQIQLERFAKLVAAAERKESAEHYLKLIRDCVASEREACAKVCEELATKWYDEGGSASDCAAAIRARGDKHD